MLKRGGQCKLDRDTVLRIRERYAAGSVTQGQLSREYGVSVTQIARIVRGESWQDVPMGMPTQSQIDESAKRMMNMYLAMQGKDPLPPTSTHGAQLPPTATDKRKAQGEALLNEIPSAVDKMRAAVAQARDKDQSGDRLVDELKGDGDERNSKA